MPWMECSPLDERWELVRQWLGGGAPPVTELAVVFGVSEKTAHKWLKRFREGGRAALVDRSRRPVHSPKATPGVVRDVLLELRRAHPSWGPKKLVVLLGEVRPDLVAPAASTVGGLLKRAGLVRSRRRRRTLPGEPVDLRVATGPNDVWCMDFKGEFNVRGRPCYPFTVTDYFSRYLLLCKALPSTGGGGVRAGLEATFQEYGLPAYIRSDNGSPFGARGIGGLSRISVFLIRLGVRVEHIKAGKPAQNGRHERMHRTLKLEVVLGGRVTWQAQQRAFDRFTHEFNQVRPHEALQMRKPGELYTPSPRRYPKTLPEIEYPTGYTLRHVRHDGAIKWRGKATFIGEALTGEIIGIQETSDEHGWHDLHYGPAHLGLIHPDGRLIKRKKATWTQPPDSPMYPV